MLASLASINPITSRIIQAAIEVHRQLGPGLLESVYLTCLLYELHLAGLAVESQVTVPVVYKGMKMNCSFRIDLLVAGLVVVELKALEKTHADEACRQACWPAPEFQRAAAERWDYAFAESTGARGALDADPPLTRRPA